MEIDTKIAEIPISAREYLQAKYEGFAIHARRAAPNAAAPAPHIFGHICLRTPNRVRSGGILADT
jgi:hypothetical protein